MKFPFEFLWCELLLDLSAAESHVQCTVFAVFDPRLLSNEVASLDSGMVLANSLLERSFSLVFVLHFIINL